MWQYEKKDENYILVHEPRGIRLLVGPVVAIGYSHALKDARALMHKHGQPAQVNTWVSNAKESYRRNGFEDLANEFAVIEGAFDIDDLNRIIDNVSYLGEFLRKQGVEPPHHLIERAKKKSEQVQSPGYS